MITVALSARPTFASSLIGVFSFALAVLISLLRTGPRSFPWSIFTYDLIELHLVRKMFASQNNIDNADQRTSQFLVSVQVIKVSLG